MSAQGNNDYNKKIVPSETVVSRTLQAKNRLWTNVIWRTGKPALDSEWNLINDMATEFLGNLIRSSTPSGWINLGSNKYSSNSGTANNLQFYSSEDDLVLDIPNVIVNGWPILVGGVNHTDTSINSINLAAVSSVLGQHRNDFVFLEVWRAQVRSRDQNNVPIAQNKPDLTHVYAYGNTQFGGTHFVDDLVDPLINPPTSGIETSQRVQIQYRLRVVSGVNFVNSLSSGFEDSANVQGQGANPNPQITGYAYTNMGTELNDSGLWRSGAGDQASRVALGSVDGYSYAIPMFKVFRRVQNTYSDTGITPSDAANKQQANANAIVSGISDRPDGKFYNGIDATDITDLRHKVSLSEIDYSKIIEKNLHLILSGQLRSKQLQNQYDSIADTDINGYTDFLSNQGCSGKRVVWSDAASTQSDVFGDVSVNSSDTSADVYRIPVGAYGSPWTTGDQIVVQITSKLPIGSIIQATPRLYVEEKGKTVVSTGTWSGLNTNVATFTFSSTPSPIASNDIWVYYDTDLAQGNGLSNVPENVYRINYTNYNLFPSTSGYVIRGERLEPTVTRFQDLLNNPFENEDTTTTYKETAVQKNLKQVTISPMIHTTSTDGLTRKLIINTTDSVNKTVYVPFKIQHLKGIYTTAVGGTELATKTEVNLNVTAVDVANSGIQVKVSSFIAEMTSLKYDPTGTFSGGEIELLIAGGGTYAPVYKHCSAVSGSGFGTGTGSWIKLYDVNGNLYTLTDGNITHYRWSGRRIPATSGSGYGFQLNGFYIDCSGSDNNGVFGSLGDNSTLYVDMDYLGAPHDGAQVRIIYQYSPYQGVEVGGQNFKIVKVRDKGIFFNNGTGGGTIDSVGGSGTSNAIYSPMSSRLPGVFTDYLRDGSLITIGSAGSQRFNTDAWFYASYDLYGYLGGGSLNLDNFTMVASPEITSRGYINSPFVEAIFESPVVDQTNAEFILVYLVMDRTTHEVFLFVQIGDKGIHKAAQGDVYLDFFRLDEKLLIR
jgi:hypothetical protein